MTEQITDHTVIGLSNATLEAVGGTAVGGAVADPLDDSLTGGSRASSAFASRRRVR